MSGGLLFYLAVMCAIVLGHVGCTWGLGERWPGLV